MKKYKNIKIFILLLLFLAVVPFSALAAKAETNNTATISNQQLIILLQQLITLLEQQIQELQKQLTAQQQAINNLSNLSTQTTSTQPITQTQQSIQNQAPTSSQPQETIPTPHLIPIPQKENQETPYGRRLPIVEA